MSTAPSREPFLKQLRLAGEFGIGDARFTRAETQKGIERISRNACHGDEDPATVVSDLRGRVSAENGAARLTDISFHVPGASAVMNGEYVLTNQRLKLEGNVQLQESLSKTQSGVKSFLLKPLDPFFRKRKHLSTVPVRITGTRGHTSVALRW